jgi:uroporphyrinogen-III synthase
MAPFSAPRRIWVTRSQPGAEATAGRLVERGAVAVVAPVLVAAPLDSAPLDLAGVDALAFTSAAAVDAFAALTPRRDLPVFAVGERTAARAGALGFHPCRSAGGDARDLAALIAAQGRRPRLVFHPAAEEPAADLVALLGALGVAARSQAVYRTLATPLAAAPADIDAVLIHSAKAALRVAALIGERASTGLEAFAISEAAAAPLAAAGFARIAWPERPSEALLLQLAAP